MDSGVTRSLISLAQDLATTSPTFALGSVQTHERVALFQQLAAQRRKLEKTQGLTQLHMVQRMGMLSPEAAQELAHFLHCKELGIPAPELSEAVTNAVLEIEKFETTCKDQTFDWLQCYAAIVGMVIVAKAVLEAERPMTARLRAAGIV